MSIICPTVLAETIDDYRDSLNRVAFAKRIQIDLADGVFASPTTVNFAQAYWEADQAADLHLMYDDPRRNLEVLIAKSPHVIIIHAESKTFAAAFDELASLRVATGIALLPETDPQTVSDQLAQANHCLIFGGQLGSYGGSADLKQLHKVETIRRINPSIEIGWDGGANADTVAKIAKAGVDVINVGSAIQQAANPRDAYATLTEMTGSDL